MRGNGENCSLVNEVFLHALSIHYKSILHNNYCDYFLTMKCEEASPCSPLTQCVDELIGYSCTACPSGYSGSSISGKNLQDAIDSKQVLTELN